MICLLIGQSLNLRNSETVSSENKRGNAVIREVSLEVLVAICLLDTFSWIFLIAHFPSLTNHPLLLHPPPLFIKPLA